MHEFIKIKYTILNKLMSICMMNYAGALPYPNLFNNKIGGPLINHFSGIHKKRGPGPSLHPQKSKLSSAKIKLMLSISRPYYIKKEKWKHASISHLLLFLFSFFACFF